MAEIHWGDPSWANVIYFLNIDRKSHYTVFLYDICIED